jgi:hypothetical protein
MMGKETSAPPGVLRVAHCFQPRRQRVAQAAVDAGQMQKILAWDALAQERLLELARFSGYLFLGGIALFVGLNLLIYRLETGNTHAALSWSLVLGLVGANVLAYLLVLALHEGIHGLVFALLGGRPRFGARLPLALYCGAPNQLFTRNSYLAVGLAPLVVISLAGIVLMILAPTLAPYLQLGLIGNFSGAAGDLWAARMVLRQPPTVLFEDTATGFEVYELAPGV